MPSRQAFPIEDRDLDKWKSLAERTLSNIDGQDLEAVLQELSPEETWRTLPEELALVFVLRHATCLFYWFVDLLVERTGQRAEVAEVQRRGGVTSPAIQAKTTFASAYGFFVLASYVSVECERILRGKSTGDLAKLDVTGLRLDCGRGFNEDLRLCIGRYLGALQARDAEGRPLVRAVGDEVAVTRDYWRAVADKAVEEVRRAPVDVRACLDGATFRHGKFTVTELTVEKFREAKAVSWAPVEPREIVANTEAVLLLRRQMDRLALYDAQVGRNPLCELGGLVESILLDGPPGTGKTSLMRMAMTLLARRAEQVGLPYAFRSLTAADIKSEWYGKTAKLLAEALEEITDPSRLGLLCLDDVDLLLAGDRNAPGTGGADKDILKGLMDFFSGIGTRFTGSYCSIAATNKPTGADDALRQRFVSRLIVKGPETSEDYADLLALQLGRARQQGIVVVGEKGYEPLSRSPRQGGRGDIPPPPHGAAAASWRDLGALCEEYRAKDPRFTGRSIKNAIDAVLAEAGDYDIPEEWFSQPAAFRTQPWERRIEMVRALMGRITPEGIARALAAQFEAEARYAGEEEERRVQEYVREFDRRDRATRLWNQQT